MSLSNQLVKYQKSSCTALVFLLSMSPGLSLIYRAQREKQLNVCYTVSRAVHSVSLITQHVHGEQSQESLMDPNVRRRPVTVH